jgi:hypothetical protein
MSPSSSPVRRRRPRRTPRGRSRPSRRGAISTVVRSVLVVTAVSSIAIGTYFAFTDDVLTRLIGHQQNPYEDPIFELRAQIDRQYFDQQLVEQQLTALLHRQETLEQRTSALTSDLSATGTIKPERIAPTEATTAEEPTPALPTNDSAISSGAEREARLQSPELPASATTKHHRIYRAAHHRASLRHRVAPPKATPADQSPQLTSAITKPERGHRRSVTQ